jgi:lysine-specific histone demethylase 1
MSKLQNVTLKRKLVRRAKIMLSSNKYICAFSEFEYGKC